MKILTHTDRDTAIITDNILNFLVRMSWASPELKERINFEIEDAISRLETKEVAASKFLKSAIEYIETVES